VARKTKRKVTSMAITKARVNLGAVVRRVHLNKEYIILEKGGIPVVGIMDADEMEDYLEVHDPKVQRFIRKSHEEYLAGKSRPAKALLEELIAESTKALDNRVRKAR